MKEKDIEEFKRFTFRWEVLRLKQNYEEQMIMLFEKNYDVLSYKEKKFLKERIKEKEKRIKIGGIVKSNEIL